MSYGASKQIWTAVSKLQISYSTTELWKHNGRGCWIQTSDARFKALCLKSTWLIPCIWLEGGELNSCQSIISRPLKPLNYLPVKYIYTASFHQKPYMVVTAGIEPATYGLEGHCSNPSELSDRIMVWWEGFEPSTTWLKVRCSTNWATTTYSR